MSYNPSNSEGLFLPPSWGWPNDPKAQAMAIQQREAQTANLLNLREIATYQRFATATGQQWPSASAGVNAQIRTTIRQIFELPLGAAGTFTKNHGIPVSDATRFTRIYGVANKPSATQDYLPLPYVNPSTLAESVSLRVTSTQIIIKCGTNRTGYTATVVLEWIPA